MSTPRPSFLYLLDNVFRINHWKWSRTRGGLLETSDLVRGFRGHTPGLVICYLLLLFSLLIGPTTRVATSGSLLCGVFFAVAYLVAAWKFDAIHRRHPFRFQVVFLAVLGCYAFSGVVSAAIRGSDEVGAIAALDGAFPHVFYVLVAFNVLVASFGAWYVNNSLKGITDQDHPNIVKYSQMLNATRLFVKPEKHTHSGFWSFVRSLFTIPFRMSGAQLMTVMKNLHPTDENKVQTDPGLAQLWKHIRNDPLTTTNGNPGSAESHDRYEHSQAWKRLAKDLQGIAR